jgi:hypothetical protein
MLGTSFWSVHGILKDNMNCVWIDAKFVFCLLFVCEFLPTGKVQCSVNSFLLKKSRCHLSVGDLYDPSKIAEHACQVRNNEPMEVLWTAV